MNNNRDITSQMIKNWLASEGLTQQEFAKMCEVSLPTIERWIAKPEKIRPASYAWMMSVMRGYGGMKYEK